jgi:hypothetical protein
MGSDEVASIIASCELKDQVVRLLSDAEPAVVAGDKAARASNACAEVGASATMWTAVYPGGVL